MGPPIVERFRAEGADVVAQEGALAEEGRAARVVAEAGDIDILVANLALDPHATRLEEIAEADWQTLFDVMVHPLMRLVRAVAPAMKARGRGKIVAVTSAAPLRGIPGVSAYCAARGAQNAFVRAAGLELAPSGVQLNAIAQNYVRNEAYYPDDLVATERFQRHLAHNVPRGRLAEPRETADLAVFLASDRSDFIVAQVIPFAGGWTTTTG
jgi:2-keto-3-deoxy-L-fuconate dehydrogenase